MNEPAHLAATRASYDTVAETFARREDFGLGHRPLERSLLAAFAELVPGGRPVADIGCGPGKITAHLHELGLDAFGVDLSPRMIEIARQAFPHLRFDVGTMTALDIADGELGGIVAWWSIFHTPPAELPGVFAEFHRTLAPGGQVLVGFHVGDEHLHPLQSYGLPVTYDAYLLPPDRVVEWLREAGLVVTARMLWEGARPQACLLANKAG
ncbi:class I SAM-dependent DNA methyltransferase [Saccharothrix deserti]|uniref:class I SAM-dependent DNA methyltransferase n=1 Tax=Saccharothrix deserti TaxID=2593674 RepID=UPI00131C16DB|nr:class I SAM-dependent methyltransferase [Saccharothrix deserti]